jgi:hypothetical protein
VPFAEEGRKEDEMLPARILQSSILALVVAGVALQVRGALPGEEAARAVAARLEQGQSKTDLTLGPWPSETMFTGPATTGMVCAYEWMGEPAYREAAERGGRYILWISVAVGTLLGDEVYALEGLSEMCSDPNDNVWRAALVDFFASNRRRGGTTEGYIELFADMDPSTATFYIAYYTAGAYYVNDLDREIWRDALIRYLSRVDDNSAFPVMALGVATWALAETGPLDDVPVGPYGRAECWEGVLLRDLPGLLLTHQVPQGQTAGGSFYWRFDHAAGSSSPRAGYTEDTIYGALGLTAAASRNGTGDEALEQGIRAAHSALLDGIGPDGQVHKLLSLEGESYHAYAGEMLQGLWAIAQWLDARDDVSAQAQESPAP